MESKLTEDFYFVGPEDQQVTTYEQEKSGFFKGGGKKVFYTYGTQDSVGIPVSALLFNLVRFNGYDYVKLNPKQIKLGNKVTIEIVQGDIYQEETEAFVNMKANSNLDLEGQDRAKHVNQKECKTFIQQNGNVKTGACGISSGDGKSKKKKVIHAVPPIFKNFSQKNNENLLTALMINILEMARSQNLKSVSIPALSKEIGMPMEDCGYIMIATTAKWCGQNDLGALKQIRFVNKDEQVDSIFNSFFGVLFQHDKGEKQNMNDRKFTVRKSRKSTKKGGPGKNDKAAKDDTFGGYQVDPVEESNQKIALIMNELMQADEMKQEEEEGKTDLDTTFAYEDKVNNEEFKDLIAKTKAIMEEVEEEDEYDEEDENENEPNDSEEGEENISDEETPKIQTVMTKINKISMCVLNTPEFLNSKAGKEQKQELQQNFSGPVPAGQKVVKFEPLIADDEFQEADTALSVYSKVQELLAMYRPNNGKLNDKVAKLQTALKNEETAVVDHRKTIKINMQ